MRAHYGFRKSYASHAEMLLDPAIDAVVCVTRRQNTGPVALDVLRAGKHLLTEKPMAPTLARGRVLVEEARRHGVVHAVGYMRRHDEGVQKAKQWLDGVRGSGELGALNFVRAHCYGGDSYCGIEPEVTSEEGYPSGLAEWEESPEWVPEARRSQYASFNNVFSHTLNLLRYLVGGTPEIDHADLANPSGGLVVLDFGGFRATLEAGRAVVRGWDEVLEFFFDSGRLRLELPPAFLANVPARVTAFHSTRTITLPQSDFSWSFRRQAEAFVADVTQRRTPLASGEDALEDLRLLEDIWRCELHAG